MAKLLPLARFVSSEALLHHEFMRFRRTLVPFLAATFLLASCGSDSKDEAAEPVVEQTTTTTTIDIRSRQVPENPDVAYVTAVVNQLFRIRGDIRRDVYATQSYSKASEDRIVDIYTDDQAVNARRVWSAASTKPHPESDPVPGNEKLLNVAIIDSKPGCLVLTADNDNSAVLKTPTTPMPKFVVELHLRPTDNRTNPTPWKIAAETNYDESKKAGYICVE